MTLNPGNVFLHFFKSTSCLIVAVKPGVPVCCAVLHYPLTDLSQKSYLKKDDHVNENDLSPLIKRKDQLEGSKVLP